MSVRKIAISLPEDVLLQVDRLAKRAHTTRSGYIARVLALVSNAGTQAEITGRLNQLFGDGEVADEQADLAGVYLRAAEAAEHGDTEW